MSILQVAHAQYLPSSSQPFQFASGYNPAFSGIDPHGDLKLGYRYQWAGFGDAAPKFINMQYNVRLKQPVDLITHSPRMSNASEINTPSFVPAGKRVIHGLGVNFIHESNSIITHIGGAVSYAFHYPISKNTRLSLGASAAVENVKLDMTKLTVGDPNDDFYQRLVNNGVGHTEVSLRGGMAVYGKNFFFAVSYLPIFRKVIQKSEPTSQDPQAFYKGTVQTGASFDLGPGVTLKPSVLALLNFDNKLSLDYSVKAYVQNKVWFGVTYRDIKSAVVLLGLNVNQFFGAAYSYEMSMGEFKKFNDGSHEIVLSFKFNNFKHQGPSVW
jgi:type IX secretion system PorP/SprF family membrane protein